MNKNNNSSKVTEKSIRNSFKTALEVFGPLRNWCLKYVRPQSTEDPVREAIEDLIEDSENDATPLEAEERNLLSNILRLKDRAVSDVMVPRADISALDVNASFADLIKLINSEAHSRVPIFQETLDDAIGMVHIKDVMAAHSLFIAEEQKNTDEDLHLRNIMRDILFVSPSMQVLELLLEMRAKRIHMALVVDEFGGVDGLVTIEDLVEEIVGEIEDEHDQDVDPQLLLKSDGLIEADARVLIASFEEIVGRVVTDDERMEFDTLGGLVFSLAGRVPIRGELVRHSCGMEIEIVDADPRRIKSIRIRGLKFDLPSNDLDSLINNNSDLSLAP
jgi:magnesium and cobalt transporter